MNTLKIRPFNVSKILIRSNSVWKAVDSVQKQSLEDIKHAKSDIMKQFLSKVMTRHPTSIISSQNIEEYIQKRLVASGLDGTPHPVSTRILSALLTFPLTLSHALQTVYPHPMKKMNILVLGARSEASLSLSWWKELLYTTEHIEEIHVKMIGPGQKHVNKPAFTSEASWTISSPQGRKEHKIAIEGCKDMALLHELPSCHQLLMEAHLIVLFHPGFGTVSMKPLWYPTLQLLWHTRKPIFCTAYSPLDIQKDLQFLSDLSHQFDEQDLGESYDFLMAPQENPYASKKVDFHEKTQEITISNYYSYCFHSK